MPIKETFIISADLPSRTAQAAVKELNRIHLALEFSSGDSYKMLIDAYRSIFSRGMPWALSAGPFVAVCDQPPLSSVRLCKQQRCLRLGHREELTASTPPTSREFVRAWMNANNNYLSDQDSYAGAAEINALDWVESNEAYLDMAGDGDFTHGKRGPPGINEMDYLTPKRRCVVKDWLEAQPPSAPIQPRPRPLPSPRFMARPPLPVSPRPPPPVTPRPPPRFATRPPGFLARPRPRTRLFQWPANDEMRGPFNSPERGNIRLSPPPPPPPSERSTYAEELSTSTSGRDSTSSSSNYHFSGEFAPVTFSSDE